MKQKGIVDLVLIFLVIAAFVIGGTMALIHWFGGDTEQITLSTTAFASKGTTFTYTVDHESRPLSIGHLTLYPKQPVFTCSWSEEWLHYPEPEQSCWHMPVRFSGTEYNLYQGQRTQLTPYITVEPDFQEVHMQNVNGQYMITDPDDWEVKLTFRVAGFEMNPSVEMPRHTFELGEDADAILSVSNPLASFSDDDAGLWVKTEHGFLMRGETWEQTPADIYQGGNSYTIPLDTGELGDVTMSVQPFAKIQADSTVTLIEPEPVSVSYEVVQSLSEDAPEPSLWERVKGFFANIFNISRWFE